MGNFWRYHLTPFISSFHRQHESIRFLTKAKASLELKNGVGQTALHIASQVSERFRPQSAYRPPPGSENGKADRATWLQADDVEIAKILLEAGADPNTASDHAMRPIHRVSRTGCIDLLAVLVRSLPSLSFSPAPLIVSASTVLRVAISPVPSMLPLAIGC